MKQILQNLGSGETLLAEVPSPGVRSKGLLIQTRSSLISLGTERMLLEFGKASLLAKARSQPDKVKQVLQKVKTDGFATTLHAVKSKLDQPLALGYCNVGVVEAVGQGANTFALGDRVISNGGHAEMVSIPMNLCAKVPDGVSDEAASFTVLASIGLQGVRLSEPTLGESFVVTGLGLIGLLTVQLLRANGCRVLGLDFDEVKCERARSFGAEAINLAQGGDPVQAANAFSNGRGVDGVIITASTKSSEPLSQAAQMCRQRGRVVLVGVIGSEWSRADFYEKEISFQVSCSYGPGRYDDQYEQGGQDYPFGFVRWTQQRNFESILQLMASGAVDPLPLISHRFSFDDALSAYEQVSKPGAMGIVLEYPKGTAAPTARTVALALPQKASDPTTPVVGVIGAGNFTGQVLLPVLAATGARLHTLASSGGVTSTHHGKKHGFEHSTTDTAALIDSAEINTVFITTRHSNHADLVIRALQAGKNVFVEKPLAITHEQLNEVTALLSDEFMELPRLMIGFNRRFAPLVQDMKRALKAVSGPISMVMTVNAGAIPASHWTQDPLVGGGRLAGEGCHFIDLLRYLAGSEIESIRCDLMESDCLDTASIHLKFSNGSIGTVHYFSNGHKDVPKERVDVFAEGKVLSLDNFRALKAIGWSKAKSRKLSKQDKGHAEEVKRFIDSIQAGAPSPIPVCELIEVSRATLNISPWS